MKTLTKKMTIAAATLLVAAGAASAQSLKAEIPFSFRAGTATMAPGAYEVSASRRSGINMITLYNIDAGKIIQLPAPGQVPERAGVYGQAKLVFNCAASTCTLRGVWTGTPGHNYEVPAWRSHDKELAAVRVISVKLQ
jgi:hypothetical protein